MDYNALNVCRILNLGCEVAGHVDRRLTKNKSRPLFKYNRLQVRQRMQDALCMREKMVNACFAFVYLAGTFKPGQSQFYSMQRAQSAGGECAMLPVSDIAQGCLVHTEPKHTCDSLSLRHLWNGKPHHGAHDQRQIKQRLSIMIISVCLRIEVIGKSTR